MRHFNYAKREYPEITEESFLAHHRRITPNECTATAYFGMSDITIRKEQIDRIIDDFRSLVSNLEIT